MVANIEGTATKLGVDLPPAFSDAVADARRLLREVDFTGAVAELNAAAITALRQGREPGADPLVQRKATEVALANSGISNAAAQWAGDTLVELVNQYADEILTSWAAAIRSDLDTLEAAGDQLELADLNAADPLLLKRANKLGLWADSSSAAERADAAVAGLRFILKTLAIGFDGPTGLALLIAPDADLPTVTAIAARATRGTLSSWTAARCGAPLRLPTVRDYCAAVARVTAERQERERQAEAEAEAEPKRQRRREWVKVSATSSKEQS
jgi:hypothetical protein